MSPPASKSTSVSAICHRQFAPLSLATMRRPDFPSHTTAMPAGASRRAASSGGSQRLSGPVSRPSRRPPPAESATQMRPSPSTATCVGASSRPSPATGSVDTEPSPTIRRTQ